MPKLDNAIAAAGTTNPMWSMMQLMTRMMGGGIGPLAFNFGAMQAAPAALPAEDDPGLDAPVIRAATTSAAPSHDEVIVTGTIIDALFSAAGEGARGGIPQGATIALAGPPGKGKTRTALAALSRVAAAGYKVALVVAEEGFQDPAGSGRDDLCSRLTKVGMAATGIASEAEFARRVLENVYVLEAQYHKGRSWEDFVALYRNVVEQAGIHFAVIDSMNMLDPLRAHTADNLSALAHYNRERDVSCICIGQIKDSGDVVGGSALEHSADAVFLVEDLAFRSKQEAAAWGVDFGRRIDVLRGVRSSLGPVFPPLRVARKEPTGELIAHPVQPPRSVIGQSRGELNVVEPGHIRDWLGGALALSEMTRSIGYAEVDSAYLEDVLRLPRHVQFAAQRLVADDPGATHDQLASISFFSLCRGLFLPLYSMAPERVGMLFGFAGDEPLDTAGRDALLAKFLAKDIGLSLVQKLACILGDPFEGRTSSFKRDSLIRLLLSMSMIPRRTLLDRLTQVGDVAALFAESRPALHANPPLTAAEVLLTLRYLRTAPRTMKFELLRSLLGRMGKLEAYFLAKLMLRKAGFGFDYQGGLIARALADRFGAPADQVAHAMALTDPFKVAELLSREGAAGLRKIRLQPLVAVPPALASGSTEEIKRYPVWVERKYDGIRFMLHKSTDPSGAVLCAAYTRGRKDWLELVPGLDAVIKMLPPRNVIIDGELYGTIMDLEGARPASVYEVYAALQGERAKPVSLRFAAFDIIYLNGADLTGLPLSERRQRLSLVLAPFGGMSLPVPMMVAEGQLASNAEDVKRLFHHFRSQGYEGIISKDLSGKYALGARDATWLKRKPELTLDLVLLAGVFAVTEKKSAGLFGSYAVGARTADGGFQDVGDVAGVDRERDAQIQQEIMRDGLITGRRIERQSASGVRPGIELRPAIVVTVRFEGIIKESGTDELKMRDPKLVVIRADKSPSEANTVRDIEEIWLRQRVG